jgi:hypothetical protein
MRTWIPIVVPIIIAVLTILANAMVNTTIKFAPDAASAKQELKRLGSTALRRLLDTALVVSLAYNAFSGGPVTGLRVFVIALRGWGADIRDGLDSSHSAL